MHAAAVLCVALLAGVAHAAEDGYFLGAVGDSCTQTCYKQGMNCNPRIVTDDSPAIFAQLGVTCATADPKAWWAEDQPSFVPGGAGNGGQCLGYNAVPAAVVCSGAYPTTQRVCHCDAPSKAVTTFGTGLSGGAVTTTEQFIFNHHVVSGDTGVMTHFWTTYGTPTDDGVVFRYYIDGETTASIVFEPSLACGVGFYDYTAPWGTQWFGKGANNGGWFWNFRVPFHKSILISVQHMYGDFGGFYTIVRGGTNIPITVGGLSVPLSTARLVQTTTNAQFQPLEWVTLVDVPRGSQGLFWMHTLQVTSGNENFLEGCYHMYTGGQDWPGTLLSTGTEDYFDSAWYFDAGEFRLPVAGYTHYAVNSTTGVVDWSAYRFHDMDPVAFNDGLQIVWRVGDTLDPAGLKCFCQNGTTVGTPTASAVKAYAWTYTF